MISTIPSNIFKVKGSLNTHIPIITAVSGSKAPSTEVNVEPIFLTALTKATVDTIVGIIAKDIILITEDVSCNGNH